MEEIKLNLENLSKEERSQLMSLIEKANKEESKIWKPEYGDNYYYIRDADCNDHVLRYSWSDDNIDNRLFEFGNCFKTKEEAEFSLERHKVIVELERFAREHNTPLPKEEFPRFYISFNPKRVSVTEMFLCVPTHKNLCFTSKEIAEEAIKYIGEDRLRKYYFGAEE